LGQFISHSGAVLTLGTWDRAPSQHLIWKKALAPYLCRYLFRNLFICSDLLASIRKSKGFIMILADNPAGKICKQLQYTVRSLATPPPLTEAIPQQHPECSISSACTPAPGPGGDVVRSDKLLGMGLITVTRNFLSGCLGASVQADTEVKRGGTSSLRDESSCGTAPWQSGS